MVQVNHVAGAVRGTAVSPRRQIRAARAAHRAVLARGLVGLELDRVLPRAADAHLLVDEREATFDALLADVRREMGDYIRDVRVVDEPPDDPSLADFSIRH